jgi:hypothetical protein
VVNVESNRGWCGGGQFWPETTDEWNRLSDENYPLMNASVQPDKVWPEERFFDYRIATKGGWLGARLGS